MRLHQLQMTLLVGDDSLPHFRPLCFAFGASKEGNFNPRLVAPPNDVFTSICGLIVLGLLVAYKVLQKNARFA